MILQLKRGAIRPAYFAAKFGVDVARALRATSGARSADDGYLATARRRPHRAHARGPAARGHAAPPLLPARAPRSPIHVKTTTVPIQITNCMTEYDAIVIGGGPSGSTAGALLAEHGHRVLLLEREPFPRYHIGESLIPYTWFTLNRLGVVDWLRQSACPKKYSVQFVSITGKVSQPFYFFQTIKHECSQTWQVWRGEFDADAARQRAQEGRRGAAGRDRARRADGGLARRRRARGHEGRRQGRGDPRQGRGRRERAATRCCRASSAGRTRTPT